MEETTRLGEQFYVFRGPDGWAWAEYWRGVESMPRYIPTPFKDVDRAYVEIARLNPGAVVDWIADDDEQRAVMLIGAAGTVPR